MGFHMLMGGDPIIDLIGIGAGHAYIFCKEVLPRSHGYRFLQTPMWLKNLIQRQVYDRMDRPRFERMAGGHIINNPNRDANGDAGAGPRFRAFGGGGVRLG